MTTQKLLIIQVAVAAMVALAGCKKAQEVASPDCAALAKGGLSEAEQIELAKTCPRAGSPFKPSPVIKW